MAPGWLSRLFGGGSEAPSEPPAPRPAPEPTPTVDAGPTVEVLLEDVGAKKIQVIKILRERTGLGLREAKELADDAPSVVRVPASGVESLLADLRAAGASVGTASPASSEDASALVVVVEGRVEEKIRAIKAVRELTGLGLREAKELVERPPPFPVLRTTSEEAALQALATLTAAGLHARIT